MQLIDKYHSNFEAGIDEAGRGALCGPVVAASVILPPSLEIGGLDDSKKISAKKRLILRDIIIEKALYYGYGIVGPKEIDDMNVLNATLMAMHLALDDLTVKPHSIIVDGNRFNQYKSIPHCCIIKGDSLYKSIAAASILAKTKRDEIMLKYHTEFPEYQWDKNKGYPTKSHRIAIKTHGQHRIHRRSFKLKTNLL